jgi:hypothetical protein
MPTPEEVDAAGVVTVDANGRLAHISRWRDTTFDARPIAAGRWYHVLAADLVTSYGMIDYHERGESYAFHPYEVGQALGKTVRTLDEGLQHLVSRP